MKSNKFLQFNGKTIFFQSFDGEFWIAIKPICDVLNVDYSRQLRTLKSDDTLSGVWSLQTMHDSTNRLQKMACLPEKYVYGWIFSLQSQSEELKKYKIECYDLLFNYFHGTITGRKELLKQKIEVDVEISHAENLLQESEEYKNLVKFKKIQTDISKSLKKNDRKALQEIRDLFNYEN